MSDRIVYAYVYYDIVSLFNLKPPQRNDKKSIFTVGDNNNIVSITMTVNQMFISNFRNLKSR